jgi:uroporphyrinogen decarboxylase
VKPFLADLRGAGFDVLNWSHKIPAADAFRATEGKLCLMGNVAPLDLGVNGSPGEVLAAARDVLRQAEGRPFVLSLGGGTSPGMPQSNIEALQEAL